MELRITEKGFALLEELKQQPNWPVIQWLTHGDRPRVPEHRKPPQSYFMSAALMGLGFNCNADGYSFETAETLALESEYSVKTLKRGLKLLVEDGLIYPITVDGVDGYIIAWKEGIA
jgi:hypothetical protein